MNIKDKSYIKIGKKDNRMKLIYLNEIKIIKKLFNLLL